MVVGLCHRMTSASLSALSSFSLSSFLSFKVVQFPFSAQYHVCEGLVWRVCLCVWFSLALAWMVPALLLFTDWVPVMCRFWWDALGTHQPANQPTDPPRRSHSLLGPILHLAHCSTELTFSLSVPPSSVVSLPAFCYQPWLLTWSCYWVGVWPLLPQKKSTCCVSFHQLSS